MKRPLSQRTKRQGGPPTLYRVGAPYDPRRRSWPEGADYNFRSGGHQLRLFLARASKSEVEAVEDGKIGFGLLLAPPDIVVISRFHAPGAGRVVMSFDCSYQWHRGDPAERTAPPAWEEVSPALRAPCTVLLIEATDGILKATRAVSFSPEFTRSFHRAIAEQAALPYDPASHDRAIAETVGRYDTDQLWARCQYHCVEGD